jgi:hypothetical protein
MHTDIEHLVKLFSGVRDVRETMKTYGLAPTMLKPSLWDLQLGFENTYRVKIERVLVEGLPGNLVRGMYLRYNDLVKIVVDSNQSENFIHYVTVKELCHLILNDAEYMTAEPVPLIEMMIYEETSRPMEGEAPLDLVSDMWTKCAAHELLFPYEIREQALVDLASGDTTKYKLAQQHDVPEHVIEWTLRPKYMAMCKEAWSRVSV